MSKVKLTKGELKRQRDSLSQFRHYLPTLQLKKQQLQSKILEARRELRELEKSLAEQKSGINEWVGLLGDPDLAGRVDLKVLVVPEDDEVLIETVNVAGAKVPFLKEIRFKQVEYDYYDTPFWLDRGVASLQDFARLFIQCALARRRIEILNKELRVTTQRVNLFEKVKIPESQENIRRINIYLGDQQSNAVGISKVAKRKIAAQAQPVAV